MKGFALTLPDRILFGRGEAASAAPAAAALGPRVLVVRGHACAYAETLIAALEALGCTVTVQYGAGEPTLPQVEAALTALPEPPDGVVAIGGGSVLDLGKALAALAVQPGAALDYLEVVGKGRALDAAPVPFIAVPTTAGTGAEVTRNAVIGVPGHRRKVSLRDARMLPVLAIVDPALTDTCPAPVTLASGLDAITQVIEPYLSTKANPVTDALCRDAIPRGLSALVRLMSGEEAAARDELASVSLTGGIALANAGLGAVHGLAGVLGGQTGMAHGAICGRLLAPCLRANDAALRAAGAPIARMEEVMDMISNAFRTPRDRAFARLEAWADGHGLPYIPYPAAGAAELRRWAEAAQAASSMKANPVPLSLDRLVGVLHEACR